MHPITIPWAGQVCFTGLPHFIFTSLWGKSCNDPHIYGGTEAQKELSQGDKALNDEMKFKPCSSHHVTPFPNIAHTILSPEGYKKKWRRLSPEHHLSRKNQQCSPRKDEKQRAAQNTAVWSLRIRTKGHRCFQRFCGHDCHRVYFNK